MSAPLRAPLRAPQSDAFVFFGATGDLAFKQVFPALNALVNRDGLDIPIIGMARAGWDLQKLRARARDSLEKAGKFFRGGVRETFGAAALRGRRLHGSLDIPKITQGARFGGTPDPLPRHSAEHVSPASCRSGEIRLCGKCAGHRRKAVRSGSRLGASARQHPAMRCCGESIFA